MSSSDEDVTINPQSRVSVALLGGIFAVTSAALVGGTRWATRIEVRLERIEVELISKTHDNWSGHDMTYWASELQRLNRELAVPTVKLDSEGDH